MNHVRNIIRICFFVSGLILIYRPFDALAQVPDTEKHVRPAKVLPSDTLVSEKDKEKYEAVKKAASKRKWTDILYSALINDSETPDAAETNISLDEKFKPFDGLTINDIKVIVLEPFGTDINRPDSANTDNWLNSTADNLHINTKRSVVRGNLLFKRGDEVNSLVIAESEAFLRNTDYIHDARILIDSIPGTRTADVTVIVRDVFSLGLDVHSLSVGSADIELFDKNFLGIGSRLWVRGIYDKNYNRHFGGGIGYLYTNIKRTFINLEGSYLDMIWAGEWKLSAERPLQTSLKYYGQLSYYRMEKQLSQSPWDSISPPYNETYSITLGRAFNVFDPRSSKRVVVAARYIDNNMSYAAVKKMPNPLQYEYATNRSILTQYSLYSQRYYRQYMIHNFGVTENIAYGYNVSAQLGYTDCPGFFEGTYASLSGSVGNLFDFGNIYVRAAIGSHFNHAGFYQGIVRFNGNYFTPLFYAGKSRVRNFINVNYANTLNSVNGMTDYVYFSTLSTMNTYYFDQQAKGSERFMINLETDFFTTLDVIGFRFLVFSFFDGGWLKDNGRLFESDNFYWGFGLGLRIRNDMLVFRTLVIKVGYYPRFNQNAGDILQISTSEPQRAPTFVPDYPQEIMLR